SSRFRPLLERSPGLFLGHHLHNPITSHLFPHLKGFPGLCGCCPSKPPSFSPLPPLSPSTSSQPSPLPPTLSSLSQTLAGGDGSPCLASLSSHLHSPLASHIAAAVHHHQNSEVGNHNRQPGLGVTTVASLSPLSPSTNNNNNNETSKNNNNNT
ncbi:hypothetical protein FHG87_010789, partial [Trinorchestia longiramus]